MKYAVKLLYKWHGNDSRYKAFTKVVDREIKYYCIEQGFNERVHNRIKSNVLGGSSLKSIQENISELKSLLEYYGHTELEFCDYINTNSYVIDRLERVLSFNVPILDYAGILGDTLKQAPSLLYRTYAPEELYSIIRWHKSNQPTVNAQFVESTISMLTPSMKAELKGKYPLSNAKMRIIKDRYELVLAERKKEMDEKQRMELFTKAHDIISSYRDSKMANEDDAKSLK